MALKKRRRSTTEVSEPVAATPPAKTATLNNRKSSSEIQAQLNERLATTIEKSGEGFRLERLSLAKIVPDPDNQRTWYINQGAINILSSAFQERWEEGVKSALLPEEILTRCLEQIARYAETLSVELPPRVDITDTVQGIWDFAVHLKTEPLLQPFAVTLAAGGKYQVVFGNRRFIASYIAHGNTREQECLNYVATPEHPAAKRFVENNQRSDLPLQAKVADFRKAVAEIRRNAAGRVSNVEIANKLGVGRNLVQRLEKISTCNEVELLMNTGQIRSVEFAYNMAVLEGSDKATFKAACKVIAENGEPSGDFKVFKAGLGSKVEKKPAKRSAGRPSKIKFPAVSEPRVLRRLFAPEVLERPQWQAIDWEDTSKPNIDRIEKLIKQTLETLVKDLQQGA
tara:strand:+ start:6541 stop:7734 length:1194 start_codon:yes stop_codon:yes gene_type:complete